MKGTRKARLRKAQQKEKVETVSPTPQTVRKLRTDTVLRHVRRGRLTPFHMDAALEIRSVHEAVGRGMFPTSQLMAFGEAKKAGPGGRDFMARMADRERYVWEHHYLPWCAALGARKTRGPDPVSWLTVVTAIIVDNITLREAEARFGLSRGDGLTLLRAGLDCYPLDGARYAEEPVISCDG